MKNVIKNTAAGTKVQVTKFDGTTFIGTIVETGEMDAFVGRQQAYLSGKAIKVSFDHAPGQYGDFSPKTGLTYGSTYQRSSIKEL